MAIRLAGMGMDILKIKSNLATGEAISGTTKATGVMSSLTKAIFGATAAQQGLTAAVMGTTRAYQAQGAAGAMAMGGAGMGPMVYTNSRGKKTMPDGWAGYVKATKGKNPWTAPQKMNGQWVIYNPQQGNKIFETREAARQFRRQYTPENYRPATAEEIKKGWGVSWFGTAPGTTKAEKAAGIEPIISAYFIPAIPIYFIASATWSEWKIVFCPNSIASLSIRASSALVDSVTACTEIRVYLYLAPASITLLKPYQAEAMATEVNPRFL